MLKYFLIILFGFHEAVYAVVAGGRPNAFSDGNNAFAGVVNPANAVWIEDRFDFGAFWVNQKSSLNNRDNNPLFPPGKLDLTYRSRNLFTIDGAIHKRFKFSKSLSLAAYTLPSTTKLRTKVPIPIAGTTPMLVDNKIQVISGVFSFKLNTFHSLGLSLDYFYFSHRRNGFQNSDNPLRSVSPGHVTNNGKDHSSGMGFTIGWRWKITNNLNFGLAWTKKSYCGQYRRYRGFEPHHAKNYIPQAVGAGFSYRFNFGVAMRLEVLWSNFGNLPNSNNNVLSDGSLNLNKRGSNKSPGPGLRDATLINFGIGYQLNKMLSVGAGFSHRIKLSRKSHNILSHSYTLQTIYEILSLGANFKYKKHDLFLVGSYGFKNKVSGFMPIEVGGGKFEAEKQIVSLSISWGYLY